MKKIEFEAALFFSFTKRRNAPGFKEEKTRGCFATSQISFF